MAPGEAIQGTPASWIAASLSLLGQRSNRDDRALPNVLWVFFFTECAAMLEGLPPTMQRT
jgi:hypothetical protein